MTFNKRIEFIHKLGVNSIELSFVPSFVGKKISKKSLVLLSGFDFVSIHAPISYRNPEIFDKLNELVELTNAKSIGFHPIAYDLSKLKKIKCDVAIENMQAGDFAKIDGLKIIKKCNYYLLYDVLHSYIYDKTLNEGNKMKKEFKNRMKEVHVSGLNANGVHTPLILMHEKNRIVEHLKNIRDVPFIIESCIPRNRIDLFKKEIEYIKLKV